MKKNYEITEKQLTFLNGYLLKKYPDISDETRIELVDHLISDFEATTENGNLSQYLSNELGFIRKFVFTDRKKFKSTYSKETWLKFSNFFTDLKLLPFSLLIIIAFYFLSENVNNKTLYLVLLISQTLVFAISVFFGSINKKQFRKLEEVQFLGSDIWLPFLLVSILSVEEIKDFILSYSLLFTVYASFVIIFGLAAFIVVRKNKKHILEKYKHLLN
ncbi:hypothetical protein H9I45_11140 [Polaribacter haliotis]|uniref:Uncharacterized protein n=1 Tax=Polaribacter haliotis TaxID=1888915 RepID=A0A7L8AD39_9FLAO|nr:hypothetical protein [Polaribacter haliotis]QOD59901.1 hypothetical protein H9I45_11140 [Polaribacter haliotis]